MGGSGSSWLDSPFIKLYDKSVSQDTITHVVTWASGTNDYGQETNTLLMEK